MKRVIRISQLASSDKRQGMLPMSKSTIWRKVLSGEFPKPFKLSERVTVWDMDEVERWLANQRGK